MGMLVDGKWTDEDGIRTEDGRFIRPESPYRNWITRDGSPGPSGDGGFKAEAGRYHLYVSHNCPWAYRAVVFRKLNNHGGGWLKKVKTVYRLNIFSIPGVMIVNCVKQK